MVTAVEAAAALSARSFGAFAPSPGVARVVIARNDTAGERAAKRLAPRCARARVADERESLLWGFVNCLHAQVRRLDRSVDRLAPELRDLQKAQDGTEINARELELITHRAQNLGDRRDAFEQMRDAAATAYRAETGDTWRPRHGSHTSQTGHLTSAAIDARDFLRARKDRDTRAHLPEGTLIAITGGKEVRDAGAVIARLDKVRAKYDDMVLLHGGSPGVEKVAAQWADRQGVDQVVCKPDWDRHGRAAPFRRNDELLDLLPKGVLAFPGSGITGNLVDKAVKLGIPVQRCTNRRAGVSARARAPAERFAHFAPHRAVLRRPHRCGRLRLRLRQRAAHDCLRLRPHRRPLTRRGGSSPRASPASIPPSLMLHAGRPGPPGAALVLTPDASLMQGSRRLLLSAGGCPCPGRACACPPMTCRNSSHQSGSSPVHPKYMSDIRRLRVTLPDPRPVLPSLDLDLLLRNYQSGSARGGTAL